MNNQSKKKYFFHFRILGISNNIHTILNNITVIYLILKNLPLTYVVEIRLTFNY